MVLSSALPSIIFSVVSRDGIRKSEGTIGTEPTQGYSQLTLRDVRQLNDFFMLKGEGRGDMPLLERPNAKEYDNLNHD